MMRGGWAAPLFAGFMALVAATAARGRETARVPLTEGDVLELSVIGVPELSQRVQVGPDGRIVLPLVGEKQAAGLTEAELRQELQTDFEQVVFRRAEPGNRDSQHTIAAREVFLRVVEYVPVYVGGLVNRPGTVPFRAGLTVRQALAVAGGIGSSSGVDRPTLTSLIELQAQARTTRLELSRELARNWRVRNALGMPAASAPQQVRVKGDEAIWDVERASLAALKANLAAQEASLQEGIELADRRITVLESQKKGEEEGAALDSAEVDKANDLYRRGLVNVARVTEVRRSALLAASRALQTAVAADDARRQKQELEARLEKLKDDFRHELFRELEQSEPRLQTLRTQLDSMEAKLDILTRSRRSMSSLELEVTLFRRGSGRPDGQVVDSDTALMPGDVLEFNVTSHEEEG